MYDEFAADFDRHAASSAYNAHYDRPALLAMLGDVSGLSVLDAGCGSGLYAEEFIKRGATVVGVDESANMIRLARARNGHSAAFRVHDLEQPLTWAADRSFDRVVMALVLHHLHDPQAVLREFHRVLRDDGRVLLSTVHPVSDWHRLGGSYFADEQIQETWGGGMEVEYRRAPLTALAADFSASGFVIESLVEPQPASSMAAAYPCESEKLTTEPGFIAFALMKHPNPEGWAPGSGTFARG